MVKIVGVAHQYTEFEEGTERSGIGDVDVVDGGW
jgi:hypothetical protein